MPYDDNYQYDNGDLNQDEIVRKYMLAKMSGKMSPEESARAAEMRDQNRQLESQATQANLMAGLNNASALISGGRYKADNSDLMESNKDRDRQVASNDQALAAGQSQASKERQNAIAEYLAGKKQNENLALQKDQLSKQEAWHKETNDIARANSEERARSNAAMEDLKRQISEAKISGATVKQPHEQQKMLDELSTTAAKRSSVSNMLEERLKKYRSAIDAGDADGAVKEGQQMLKLLNSPDNPDAVGAEESQRLGSFLEKKVFNLRQPGSMFGRDLDRFDTQVANSVNIMRDAAKANIAQVAQLKAGNGLNLQQVDVRPNSLGIGTAGAAPAAKDINLMSEEELLKELGE